MHIRDLEVLADGKIPVSEGRTMVNHTVSNLTCFNALTLTFKRGCSPKDYCL